MTEDEHVALVQEKAKELAEALVAATEAGVSQAVILPTLMATMREAGLMPG